MSLSSRQKQRRWGRVKRKTGAPCLLLSISQWGPSSLGAPELWRLMASLAPRLSLPSARSLPLPPSLRHHLCLLNLLQWCLGLTSSVRCCWARPTACLKSSGVMPYMGLGSLSLASKFPQSPSFLYPILSEFNGALGDSSGHRRSFPPQLCTTIP